MSRKLIVVLYFTCCWILLSNAADLKSYKDVYDKNLEDIILGHGPKVTNLQSQYAKSLDDLRAKMQGRGDLEKTRAVMAEIERFQKDKALPAAVAETEIPELKTLETSFMKQASGMEMDKARRVVTLATQYEAALERLQKELTKAGKFDEATAVQSERGDVKNSDYLVAANRVLAIAPAKVETAGVSEKEKKVSGSTALSKTMELNLGKGVKMSLVLIPAGKFTMGSQPGDEGKKPDELPPHEVTISMPFYMGIYEVRQQEYEAVTGANPSTDRSKNLPVHNVSWDDCMSFCKQASIKTGKTVRLPTEAEWEYACRAGTKTRFSFGDDAGDVRKYANYRDRSYTPVMTGVSKNDFPSDGHDKDAPVGTYKPNPWGLYDMHGNVNEWCSDWYGESYYASSPSVDPKGPADGDRKVQKGGSCVDDALYLRSARRCSNTPSKPHHMDIIPFGFGFRVVVEVGQ